MPFYLRRKLFSDAPRPVLRFAAVLAAAFAAVSFTFMMLSLQEIPGWKMKCYLVLGDVALLMTPYAFLRGRWRAVSLGLLWLLSAFLWANALYMRYWGDMIPLWLIFDSASYNSLVFASIGPSVRWTDLVYLLAPALATWVYVRLRVASAPPVSWRNATVIAVTCVILFTLCHVRVVLGWMRYRLEIGHDPGSLIEAAFERDIDQCGVHLYYQNDGLFYYLIRSASLWGDHNPVTLDDDSRRTITQYLSQRPAPSQTPAFLHNRDKNLIFIIVESLNSWVVGDSVDGHPVTPVLDSLAMLPGTVVALDVASQIGDGSSSDGQLMYNTGLLPLTHGAVSLMFADNAFPSLARELHPREAFEIIWENGSVWNHRRTSASYGYRDLTEGLNLLGSDPEGGIDGTLFNLAFERISRAGHPFMAEITTLSMHFPFDDPGVTPSEWLGAQSGLDLARRDYLAMTNYFDRELGRFLSRLRQAGILDNTVVVIASDHTKNLVSNDDRPTAGTTDRCLFMALNTGVTARIDRHVGQIDVFPTILDIMGRLGDARWTGLGRSMFGQPAEEPVSSTAVTDLIIRGDYFRGSSAVN